MGSKFLLLLGACALLGGCATIPTQEADGVSIDAVAKRIECELGAALSNRPELDTWALGITLSLAVDESNAVVPTATFASLSTSGIVAVNVGGGATRRATRTSLVKTFLYVLEANDRCPTQPNTPLEDSLGLALWIERVLTSAERQNFVFNKDKAIGYSLEFSLALTGGVTPSFVFRDVSGSAGVSASYKSTHSLDIALVNTGKRPVLKRVVYRPRPAAVPSTTDFVRPGVPPKPQTPQRPVVVEGRSAVGAPTRQRLEKVLEELQFRTLLPRR